MRKISKEMVEKYIMNNDMTVMPAGEYEAGIVFPANLFFPPGARSARAVISGMGARSIIGSMVGN